MFDIFKPKQQLPLHGASKQPHLINTHKGFVIDTGNAIQFTPDSRLATVFPDFMAADEFAKATIVPSLHYKRQYYAILITA